MYYMVRHYICDNVREARAKAYEIHRERFMSAWKEPIYKYEHGKGKLAGYLRYDSGKRLLFWEESDGVWTVGRTTGQTVKRCGKR